MSKKGLIRSTGVIGMATAVSRVLGFVRDIVIANLFGTSLAAQAFVVAFRIPNSLRDLVGEGATNAAIVPVLSEYKALKDEAEFLKVAKVLLNVSLAAVCALTLLGILFAPIIVRAVAPGFSADPDQLTLAVQLTRVIFPYLILIGLTAYAMGVLNALRHFSTPAFGPALLNIALIGAAVWLCPRIGVMGLAIGVLVGGVLQLGISVPLLHRSGIAVSVKEGFRHPAVRRIGKLLVPRALGTAVYQLNIFVDTICGSLAWIVGSGGVAALYYANRLIQFPLAIFGLALAQAALPKMSREFAENDIGRLKDTLSFSLRIVFLVMVPASFGLAVLGEPIIRILFQRGEFTASSTAITESALFFYCFGLCTYGGIKLLVTSFYAMHDTMTPVKTAFAAVILNIMCNVILMFPLKLGGLALATSISAIFNFLALFVLLRKRIGDFGTHAIIDSFLRVFFASVVMGIVIKVTALILYRAPLEGLLISIITGLAAFILAAYIFDVKELKGSFAWIARKR